MNDRISSEELERRAERERAKIAETAEQMRRRLTPGQLIDEVLNYARESGSAGMLHNLKGQVQDNPLALAMVGAGMAWLMAGPGYGGSDSRRTDEWEEDGYDTDAELHGLYFSDPITGDQADADERADAGAGQRISEAAKSATSAASSSARNASNAAKSAYRSAEEQARSASHAARDAYHAAENRARSAMDAASEQARHAGANARRYVERGGNMVADLMEREPLAIGALGFAVGAAIGAGLPSTRWEDRHLGPTRDKLKDDARSTIKEGTSQAGEVAAHAMDAAKHQADREGLTGDDKTLAEKGVSVAKAATDEVKKSVTRQNTSVKTPGKAGGSS